MSVEPIDGVNAKLQIERVSNLKRLNSIYLKMGRHLEDWEIVSLEQKGNRCLDWSKIKVADDFKPDNYRNNTFEDENYLGLQQASFHIGEDEFQACVENSYLSHCHIESGVSLRSVHTMKSVYVERHSKCWNVNRFETSQAWSWQFDIEVGSEVHGRIIRVFPEMDPRQAELMLETQDNFSSEDEQDLNFSVLSEMSKVENVGVLENVFLGCGTEIQGALELKHLVSLSDLEEPVKIGAGVMTRHAFLQWGCQLDRGAQLDHAFLFEHSSVDQNGMVNHAVVGSNSHIAKGEVTASFVGPFVGMHHQSLLIGTIWPEGKGNVGYGANVGSNHTGRAPDQEFWAGEGEFFGLSSSIKFPANHRSAAYSIIATGVILAPSKIELPFSLIHPIWQDEGHGPLELIPAWMLKANRYSLVRSAWKSRKRNKSTRYQFEVGYLNRRTVAAILKSLDLLENLANKSIYSKEDLGLSSGVFMRRESLEKAVQLYREALELYFGESNLDDPEILALFNHSGLAETSPERLRELKQQEYDLAIQSLEKDRVRGNLVFADYDEYHPPAEEDSCLLELRQKLDKAQENPS